MPPRKRLTYSDSLNSRPVQQKESTVERGSEPLDEVGLQHADIPETPSDGVNLGVDEMETLPNEAQCSTVGKIFKLFRLIILRSYLIDLFSYSLMLCVNRIHH